MMATQEDKAKIEKLLQGIEIPEVKLTERCSGLVKDFQQKYGQEIESEEQAQMTNDEKQLEGENPYKVDRALLEDIDKKLHELLLEGKRTKKESENRILTANDPKRPWRVNSTKEKLLRIENEIKRHHEKNNDLIAPLDDKEMNDLVNECREENSNAFPVPKDRLRHTVDAAKKNLPNFQYRKIENSTATAIMPEAHIEKNITPHNQTQDEL